MGFTRSRFIAGASALALTVGLAVAVPGTAGAEVGTSPRVLINEVYGGGGNSGATQTNDFVELYNATGSAVDLAGWSVQYASVSGSSWQTTPLTGTIAAGGYFLVGEAAGSGGTVTPTFDVVGTIPMGAGSGKVALVNSATALTCGTACAAVASVVDFVGYGTANDFAGTGPTGTVLTATTSASRSDTHANTANNAADFTAGAPSPTGSSTVEPPPVIDVGEKTIAEIQGTGAASEFVDDIATVTGVVTAEYLPTTAVPVGSFNGFVIQTAGTGGTLNLSTHTASDAIFVYAPGFAEADIKAGDYVSVKGVVGEYFGLTQITPAAATDVIQLDKKGKKVTQATTNWPATAAQRESLESMLYLPQQTFTISNTFGTNQYGEVGLAVGSTPLRQPTDVARPGTPEAAAVTSDNAARAVVLDDGLSTNFLSAANSGLIPPYVSLTKPVIVGAQTLFTKPVIVDYRNNTWKFNPTAPVTAAAPGKYPAAFTNTRTTTPDDAAIGDGELKVASFNVLNYFTTLGADMPASAGCSSFKDRAGDGVTVNTCTNAGNGPRGAWDADDLKRQQNKIVRAINALDADVVGLMEIENSAVVDQERDEAVATLVKALNNNAGSKVWAYVPSSTQLPATSEMDVISNAIIYKTASVKRVGASLALGTESGAGGAFDNAREPLAQAFEPVAGGEQFLFVVNHFKSKGSAGPWPGDVDTGDGQGASNESRTRQATALKEWVADIWPADEAVVLAGDFNSYGQEDPLQILFDAGYTDVEQQFELTKSSYSFSGQSGSLDHVLLNDVALARATGADIWNINSGESIALEYSRYNYHGKLFYKNDPYRSSDHDPVIAGLKATTPPTEVQILGINDFHGRISANTTEAGAAVLAGAVKQLRETNPKTVFAAAGDLIGASTFESFIAKDKPTIDALNAAGLEVSAVGNHEFDQGYEDLTDRVMAPYDAASNPLGGAQWEYLGANVRNEDGSAALPESWVQNFGDVQVGFVGAVTDHLDELVSPAGIEGLEIEAPVVAANREADEMKAAGVDVVVLLVHEGAATTSLSSATDPNSDMGRIVNGANENIDAIVSGHTHLSYNHAIPVQAWIDEGRAVTTRPVVSAGQYGYNLNQLVFKLDRHENVIGLEQKILPLVTTNPGPPVTYTPNYPADAEVAAIVKAAVDASDVLGAVELGELGGPFNRAKLANGSTENRGGESTLGNLVAEVQQWATSTPEAGSAQIAFMNPGGLRQDMVGNNANGYPAPVTYKQAAVVQPFANTLVNMTLTGAQIKTVLEQQWQPAGSARPFLRLGISEGFTYTYDPAAAAGSRITAMYLDGELIADADTFSVTVNSFLASGGDNFFELANGTGKRDTGKVDLQAMVDYLGQEDLDQADPDYTQRSVGATWAAGSPAEYAAGDTVAFDLSSLAFTTAADAKDAQVSVSLGDTELGTFAVDNTIGTEVFDEAGKASVSFVLPDGLPAGAQQLTVTGVTTGTTALLPITIAEAAGPTQVQILGINDFHGRISANQTEAGAAVLAGAVEELRGEYPDTVFAAAGDLIGASTFESFIAKDKPTIDALNAAGLEVSAVGNHEFDQGYEDLTDRVMAPYDAASNPLGGAQWEYLGANVRNEDGSAALPESWVQNFGDVQVGFVGAVTDHLDELVSPAGIEGLEIEAPVVAANREADEMKAAGVDVVVLLVHEGAATTSLSSATDPNSDMGRIVNGANENIDAIVSGHTHLSYNHAIPVQAWIDEGRAVTTRPVVSAGQYGYNLNQLIFTVEDDQVTDVEQAILPLVTTNPGPPVTYTPNYPADAEVAAIVKAAVDASEVLGAVELGELGGPFNRAKLANGSTENRGGESTLGNLVAEVQQWATSTPEAGAAQIAFMNPGGLRADMVGNAGSPATYPAPLTYKQAAVVQPFANTLVNMTLTGAQIKTVLEQQWQPAGSARPFLRLGISEGFTYTYDPAAAAGSRITAMYLDGELIADADTFSVTVNSFLASGGDNFFELANGTGKRDTGKVDLQAMVDYLGQEDLDQADPDYTQRSVGATWAAGSPAEYAAGDTVAFDLSSLAFTTAADAKDAQVSVSLGDTELGTFAVDNTIGTEVFDEAGKASVSFVLPDGLPAGAQQLTVTGVTTGTEALVDITIAESAPDPAVSTTTLTASAPEQTYGTATPTTFTAKVVLDNGAAAAGTVTFTSGATVLGSSPVSAAGEAKLLLPAVTPAGTLKVVATFVPTDSEAVNGSASAALTFPVRMALSSTTVGLSFVKSGSKFDLTMKATVTLNTGQAPVGTVAFNLNGKLVKSVAVSGGVATLTTSVPAGKAEVIATFTASEPNNVNRSTGRATVTVKNSASSTAVATSVAKTVRTSGQQRVTSYRMTVTAKVAAGGKAPTGKVTFTVGGKKVGTATLAKGVAKVAVTVPKGSVKVVASFTPTGTATVAASSRTVSVNVR